VHELTTQTTDHRGACNGFLGNRSQSYHLIALIFGPDTILLAELGSVYAYFYGDDELIVIFPKQVFHLTPDKCSWKPAVDYGRDVGIPEDE